MANRRFVRSTVLGVALLFVGPVLAATIIVPDDNPSPRDAVQSAAAGDTVQIRPGTYTEGIRVDRNQHGLTIEGLGGRPVLVPGPGDDGVRVKEINGIVIRGLEVQGGQHAVRSDGANGVTVDDVIASGNKEGVRIKIGNSNTVQNCVITGPTNGRGIRVDLSGALLSGNMITGAHKEGIRANNAVGIQILGNTVTGSAADGIRVQKGSLTTVDGNVSSQNTRSGIRIINAPNGAVSNNTANDNGQYGIRVQGSPPIANVADLTGAGNSATGNTLDDMRVQ